MLIDIYGKQVNSRITINIKLDDFLIKSEGEKTVMKCVGAANDVINYMTFIIIVVNIVINSSLKMIWNMLDSVQFMFVLRYISYGIPWMVEN